LPGWCLEELVRSKKSYLSHDYFLISSPFKGCDICDFAGSFKYHLGLRQNPFKTIRKEAVSVAKVTSSNSQKKMRPPLTPDANEKQMISLAMDLVRKRLIEGTASSQETTHFLKLGSMRNQLEMSRLEEENKLLRAKTKALEDQGEYKELVAEAIKAMRNYSGHGEPDEY
jgi:hypothetical protein